MQYHTASIVFVFMVMLTMTAVSAVIPVESMQIAFGDDPTRQVTISWHTARSESDYEPVVLYGTSPGQYQQQVTKSETVTYNFTAGYSHHVFVTELQPSTVYYYTCGSAKYGMAGREYKFRTAPVVKNGQSEKVEVLVVGDLGAQTCQQFAQNCTYQSHVMDRLAKRVLDNLESEVNHFVFHVGDIGYADISSKMNPPQDYEYIWNKWGGEIEVVAAHTQYMVSPGNHEYNRSPPCPRNATDFAPFNTKYRMPGFQASKPHNMWYSFNYANIHFVSISTETDYPGQPFPTKFGDQLSWLHSDLEQANKERNVRPWIIVMGHRPIYSSNIQFSNNSVPIADSLILQKSFEELFHKYQVDIYMVGHVHSYERTYPVYRNTIDKSATIHIVNGGAGNTEGLTPNENYKKSSWSAHICNSDQGYGVLSTEMSTASSTIELKWQYFRATDDGLEDEVVLVKNV